MAAAVAWVHANIASYGGDPGRLFLFGHSAGGTHVADYLFQPRFQAKTGDGLAGAIPMSSVYNPVTGPQGPNVEAYFGKDHALWPERAAIRHVVERKLPVCLVMTEYDSPAFQAETLRLHLALCQRDGICPRLKQVTGHNHITGNYHLGTGDTSLGPDLLAFIAGPR